MKLPIIRDLEKITNFLKTSLGPKSKDKIDTKSDLAIHLKNSEQFSEASYLKGRNLKIMLNLEEKLNKV